MEQEIKCPCGNELNKGLLGKDEPKKENGWEVFGQLTATTLLVITIIWTLRWTAHRASDEDVLTQQNRVDYSFERIKELERAIDKLETAERTRSMKGVVYPGICYKGGK